jgi:hypothetical protein
MFPCNKLGAELTMSSVNISKQLPSNISGVTGSQKFRILWSNIFFSKA